MRRKRRKGEVVCRCGVYRFPHRMMGGRCDGGGFVDTVFENHMHDKCRDCMSRVYVEEEGSIRCQVLDGTEKTVLCPELHEFIRYNEIRLYGVNEDREVENPKRRR